MQRRFCNSIEWRQVPLTRSNLGAREGSPGVFYKNGYVFVYGGWGFGPMRDLHAAPVDAPLQFREVSIQGAAPHPTYEAKVTVLEDPDSHEQPEVFRAVVTGGWKHGGSELSFLYALSDCQTASSLGLDLPHLNTFDALQLLFMVCHFSRLLRRKWHVRHYGDRLP